MNKIDLNSLLLIALTRNDGKCTFNDLKDIKTYVNKTFTNLYVKFTIPEIITHINENSEIFKQYNNTIELRPHKYEELYWLFI